MKPIYIFVCLCMVFLLFSFSIYMDVFRCDERQSEITVGQGRLVWQKYNCQGCHQLYGLGGYLGPDLTNVHSAEGKGPQYIKAIIKSGTAQMPSFELTIQEEIEITEFLRLVDATGSADPRNFNVHATGMISRK